MVLSSLEDPVLLSLVSFVSLSLVSSLLIFFVLSYLVQSDPERVGKRCACPQSLPWVSVLTSPETAPSSGTQKHS